MIFYSYIVFAWPLLIQLYFKDIETHLLRSLTLQEYCVEYRESLIVLFRVSVMMPA